MIQEKTNGWERLKWLVTVPVVMGAMLVFAQPEVKNKSEEIPPVVNQQDAKAEIISQEASTNSFEGIEITLLNSKDGSVLTTVKDIKHINQLKDALRKLPIDRSEPYTHVQLKASKDTPMGEITEIKQALREHYILNLNYKTDK